MSVWDEIREKVGEALVKNKGDLRVVALFISHEAEARMLEPPTWEEPSIKTKVLYSGVRPYYDQLYGVLVIYGAPEFVAKNYQDMTPEEKRLVRETQAQREAEMAAAQRRIQQDQLTKNYLQELARAEAEKGNGGAGKLVTSAH